MNLLVVCAKNQARSPMAETVCRELTAEGAHLDVRSAGTSGAATRRLTTRDAAWAGVIVAMEDEHGDHVARLWPDHAHKVRVLGIPDHYEPDEADLRAVLLPRIRALDELARG